jgi:hypothetical protein
MKEIFLLDNRAEEARRIMVPFLSSARPGRRPGSDNGHYVTHSAYVCGVSDTTRTVSRGYHSSRNHDAAELESTARVATRNAREGGGSHRPVTTGSTGVEAARALDGRETTQWQTGARPRSARDLTGVERTGALGAMGVSGEAWRETDARS